MPRHHKQSLRRDLNYSSPVQLGRLSEAIFGRSKLPARTLIYAGSYVPERKEWIRECFDQWQRIDGFWVRHSFARKNTTEYLLAFNVYGASMILETLHLLKDGANRKVFFIGALGGKDLPVGTLVLPTSIVDMTGCVSVDEPDRHVTSLNPKSLGKLRDTLRKLNIDYVQGMIASVPCVLHGIEHVKKFIEEKEQIVGMELETSAFCHYSQKEGFESYILLYVSDNNKTDIISGKRNVQKARRRSLQTITNVAIDILK